MRNLIIATVCGALLTACARAGDAQKAEVESLRQEIEALRAKVIAGEAAKRGGDVDTDTLKHEVEALRREINRRATKAGVFEKGQVLSVIAVKTSKDEAEAFVKVFRDSPKASHRMAGFLGLAVAENTKQPGSFMVVSLWKDEAALEAYTRSKGFGQDHASVGQIKSAETSPPGRFVVKED